MGHDAATTDALVIFGITGDLARQMTFRALYRLERDGLVDFPILGVARSELDDEALRDRADAAIREHVDDVDEDVLGRFAGRLRYVAGDFDDDGTYARVADALGDAEHPMFYLATPPSMFERVVAGLESAHLLRGGERVLVEKPFGHDLASARALAEALHEHVDESRLYRVDHFLGKEGLHEILSLRFANALLEPAWDRNSLACVQITMAESLELDDRGSFFDPVGQLRDDVVGHLMQVLAATAMEPPSGPDAASLQDAKRDLFRAVRDADPRRCVRGQYDGYRAIDGVDPESRTETYAALELTIDNWRWAGVPIFIRTGKGLAVTQTEVRLVFQDAPRPRFAAGDDRRPGPAEVVVRLDPSAGLAIGLPAQRAGSGNGGDGDNGPGDPGEGGDGDARGDAVCLQTRFAQEGDGAPTPYEILFAAALRGDATPFTRQDNVEQCWRILAPLLDDPAPPLPYPRGSWGPEAADELAAGVGGWRAPWRGALEG